MLLLTVGGAVALLPSRRADAFLFDIVLDPIVLVEHVLQAAELGEQIAAAVQQVESQVKQLKQLEANVAPNVAGIVSGLEGRLDAAVYSATNPGDQLNTRYLADMGSATWSQYQSDQSTWTAQRQQSLAENRELQNQVYRDMDATNRQVEQTIEASNASPGETAAIQARNDLLATASAELAKLQALKLARARLRTEQLAQQQSESSFAAAEQARVRAGWDSPAAPTETVTDPFQP